MKTGISWKLFGVIIIILLGVILAFSPVDYGSREQIDVQTVARQIADREDHITAEQLGHLIIDEDPGYMLIDIRNNDEYNSFHIKSAINIPLEHLFEPDNLDLIDRDKLTIVYSNGGTHAAQAWVLLKQKGFNNTSVLLGGLNYWVDVYSNPEPPSDVHADSEIFRYQFLQSAGPYLLGNQQVEAQNSGNSEPPPVKLPIKRKKKRTADEGC
jgi:rhodanese-related sulfurtransferase